MAGSLVGQINHINQSNRSQGKRHRFQFSSRLIIVSSRAFRRLTAVSDDLTVLKCTPSRKNSHFEKECFPIHLTNIHVVWGGREEDENPAHTVFSYFFTQEYVICAFENARQAANMCKSVDFRVLHETKVCPVSHRQKYTHF